MDNPTGCLQKQHQTSHGSTSARTQKWNGTLEATWRIAALLGSRAHCIPPSARATNQAEERPCLATRRIERDGNTLSCYASSHQLRHSRTGGVELTRRGREVVVSQVPCKLSHRYKSPNSSPHYFATCHCFEEGFKPSGDSNRMHMFVLTTMKATLVIGSAETTPVSSCNYPPTH